HNERNGGNDPDRGYSRDRRSDNKSRPYKKEGTFKPHNNERDVANDPDRRYSRDRRSDNKSRPYKKESTFKPYNNERGRSKESASNRPSGAHRFDSDRSQRPRPTHVAADDGLIRLNRYISNSGICSRRKADELIAAGVISVNG